MKTNLNLRQTTRLALLLFVVAALLGLLVPGFSSQAQQATDAPLTEVMQRFLADRQPAQVLSPLSATPCVGGFAGSYPCENVDLLAFMPLATFGASSGNDSWGWTDPVGGTEYALMGLNNGTAFVDLSDPENPVYVGKLPSHNGTSSSWRDIKVYNDHAFIVSEASGHGMQVFDLTQLANVTNPPVTFSETAHYPGFGSAHNIVINEDSGYAYAVGSGTCSGGLTMVNIQNPTSPTGAGCYSSDGYTHDAQCVIYSGPDSEHQGKEICFNANEDTLTIVDVTNKAAPLMLSRTGYSGSGYTHQGWLTEDHTYFLFDDELDEYYYGHNTRTRIMDVSNLDAPSVLDYFDAPVPAIDHNLYTKDDYVYQANYRAGMRILDGTDVSNGNLTQVAYFDIYPANDSASFNGAWNVFPYFDSGLVIISGIEQGLFIVQPTLTSDYSLQIDDSMETAEPGTTITHTLTLANTGTLEDTYELSLSPGAWAASLQSASPVTVAAGSSTAVEVAVSVPPTSLPGELDSFTLSVTSQGDPGLTAAATGTTTVVGAAGVAAGDDLAGSGLAGETAIYEITVTNTGNIVDGFTLEVVGNTWNSTLSAATVGLLAPGESETVELTVLIESGSSDTAQVNVASQFDPATTASVNVTTTTHYSYLPLVIVQP